MIFQSSAELPFAGRWSNPLLINLSEDRQLAEFAWRRETMITVEKLREEQAYALGTAAFLWAAAS